MRVPGSSSWRLDTRGGYLAELALFVRDACGLSVSGAGGDVPPLVGAVPGLAHLVMAGERQAAGTQWPSWWLRVLEIEFRDWSGEEYDGRDLGRRRFAEHLAVCDPPAFENLADCPGLRAAARASIEGFGGWQASRPQPGREGLSGSPLDWSLMQQTAEEVAFDHNVSLDAVQASVAILPVQGVWWRRVAPGVVQCSTAAATDPVTAQALLWDAFESRIVGGVT